MTSRPSVLTWSVLAAAAGLSGCAVPGGGSRDPDDARPLVICGGVGGGDTIFARLHEACTQAWAAAPVSRVTDGVAGAALMALETSKVRVTPDVRERLAVATSDR